MSRISRVDVWGGRRVWIELKVACPIELDVLYGML